MHLPSGGTHKCVPYILCARRAFWVDVGIDPYNSDGKCCRAIFPMTHSDK